jgi:ABC-2 type transport system ATP-binding protein
MNGTPAIEIRDLVKVYPRLTRVTHFYRSKRSEDGVRALDGVSLQLRRGEALGLVGTNGAGKTTLIKIVCNLLLPTAGRVTVDGLDAAKEGGEVRRRLGLVVSDERSFYWRLTARRNLEFFSALHDMSGPAASRRISELSSWLGMEEFMDQPFSDLSSGMRQRVSLARGLLHDPEILLMDEPTHSLSPEAALEVDRIFADTLRREKGKTLLIASQSLREVERVCDRMCLLDRGRILFCGSMEGFREEALRRGGGPEMDTDELFAAFLQGGAA